MKARAKAAGYTFHQYGLGSAQQVQDGVTVKGGQLMTLQQILTKLKHTGRTINILKWDCEGEISYHIIYLHILNLQVHTALYSDVHMLTWLTCAL
jgi:Methyltransferase domain